SSDGLKGCGGGGDMRRRRDPRVAHPRRGRVGLQTRLGPGRVAGFVCGPEVLDVVTATEALRDDVIHRGAQSIRHVVACWDGRVAEAADAVLSVHQYRKVLAEDGQSPRV